MSPSPPLLGTPRASFPARGSRLENSSMSPCSFGSCFSQSPRNHPSHLGSPYRKRGLLERLVFEIFLRVVLHVHCSVQCFYTSFNFSSGEDISIRFFRQDLFRKSVPFRVGYLCSSYNTTALSTLLQYGIRFLQHPLPTKPSPFLTVGIPFHICVWGLLGLPSSLCSTFSRALREALSPGCATDDKGMKKNHPYLATHHFGLGVSATFRRFLITRFITPLLLFPIGSLASPQPTFIAKC